MSFKEKYFGDRDFYRKTLMIAVPIMIQSGITNFVGMLDNIMIGLTGTAPMTGASIVNQLIFVYNLCIFGGVSGAGIFTAQYYGHGDDEGVRTTFRYKMILGAFLTGLSILVFIVGGSSLISLYLNGEGSAAEISATLFYGKEYLDLMLIGLFPFMITVVYTGTLRECGETILPMHAGIIAVFVNLVFNYFLIYGKMGFPEMGVAGAAAATVLSRFVEMLIVVIWTHTHTDKVAYFKGVYRTFRVPLSAAGKITKKGMPLLINEALWSTGVAALVQCYSVRGLSVVAAMNISNTVANVFNIVMISMGNAVGIIIGQLLGAGKMEEAVDTDRKLLMFSVLSCAATGFLMLFAAPFFPRIYNTSAEIKRLASWFIVIVAISMPFGSFLNSAYFTLRSGGKTIITFLFDSVFMWTVSVTGAFVLTRFTDLPVVYVYAIVTSLDLFKCLMGYILLKKKVWLNNIVEDG